jgi:SAM-dependent methyltransferase
MLLPQSDWDELYAGVDFSVAAATDPLRRWLESAFGRSSGSCLELGCFPGQYLAVFAERGYEVSGIDLTPRMPELDTWMRRRNYRVGRLEHGDVRSHAFDAAFDVVCSFGLIEHFVEWDRVVQRHAELVKRRGHLVISVPNFRSWPQYLFHRIFDNENLARHNLGAMNLGALARQVRQCGFEVQFAGGIGTLDFWVERRPHDRARAALLRRLEAAKPRLQALLPGGHPLVAPYYGVIGARE